jgi:hypothetical protein
VTNNYGRAAMFLLFYLQFQPDYVMKNAVFERGEIVSMANLNFGKGNLPSYDILVVEKPGNVGRLINQINFLDGQPAFYIYEN